jgi:hypothetical protein
MAEEWCSRVASGHQVRGTEANAPLRGGGAIDAKFSNNHPRSHRRDDMVAPHVYLRFLLE